MSVFEIRRRLSIQGKRVTLTLRQNSMDRDVPITLHDFEEIVVPQPDAEAKLLADIALAPEAALSVMTIEVNDQMMSAILETAPHHLYWTRRRLQIWAFPLIHNQISEAA